MNIPAVDNGMNRSEQTWEVVYVRLQRAIRHQKKQANHHHHPHSGQIIWLSPKDLCLKLPTRRLSPSLLLVHFKSKTSQCCIIQTRTPTTIQDSTHISHIITLALSLPSHQVVEARLASPLEVKGTLAYSIKTLLDPKCNFQCLNFFCLVLFFAVAQPF